MSENIPVRIPIKGYVDIDTFTYEDEAETLMRAAQRVEVLLDKTALQLAERDEVLGVSIETVTAHTINRDYGG